jgi:hypothetical protein
MRTRGPSGTASWPPGGSTRSWLVLRSGGGVCRFRVGGMTHRPGPSGARGRGSRMTGLLGTGPERRRSAWPRARPGATACAAWQRRPTAASAGPSSVTAGRACRSWWWWQAEIPPPNLAMLLRRGRPQGARVPGVCLGCWPKPWGWRAGPGPPNVGAPWAWKAKSSVKSAQGVTVAVLSGRGWDARHARPKRGADKGTLLAGNGFLLTGVGRCRPRACCA